MQDRLDECPYKLDHSCADEGLQDAKGTFDITVKTCFSAKIDAGRCRVQPLDTNPQMQ